MLVRRAAIAALAIAQCLLGAYAHNAAGLDGAEGLEMNPDDVRLTGVDDVAYLITDAGETMELALTLNETVVSYNLTRVDDIYANVTADEQPSHTFSWVAPGKGWAVATVDDDGTVHGAFFIADQGFTTQFSHETHLRRNLGEEGLRRALRTVSGPQDTGYFARRLEVTFTCGEGQIVAPEPSSKTNPLVRAANLVSQAKASHVYYGSNDCYEGDSRTHYFEHGIAIDQTFLDLFGSRKKAIDAAESTVATSSAIYEYQMNVRLRIGKILVAGDELATHEVFTTCKSGTSTSLATFRQFIKEVPDGYDQGSWHLMTNCYPLKPNGGSQTVGTANIGTAGCNYNRYGWNAAVSTHVDAYWTVYAHELGHNFNARHSFELGVGKTGGIMDYGKPNIDGRPLFQEARVTEMCALFSSLKATKCQFFYPVGSKILASATVTVPSLTSTERKCDMITRTACMAEDNYCTWDKSTSKCSFEPMMSMQKGSSCRKNKKRQATYYVAVSAATKFACMTACVVQGDCYGVEYDSSTNICDMWTVPVDSVADAPAAHECVIIKPDDVKAASMTGSCSGKSKSACTGACAWSDVRSSCTNKRFFELGGQCQLNKKAGGSYSQLVKKVATLNACKTLCDGDCTAVEYEAKSKKCFLWSKGKVPSQAKNNAKKSCYARVAF